MFAYNSRVRCKVCEWATGKHGNVGTEMGMERDA